MRQEEVILTAQRQPVKNPGIAGIENPCAIVSVSNRLRVLVLTRKNVRSRQKVVWRAASDGAAIEVGGGAGVCVVVGSRVEYEEQRCLRGA